MIMAKLADASLRPDFKNIYAEAVNIVPGASYVVTNIIFKGQSTTSTYPISLLEQEMKLHLMRYPKDKMYNDGSPVWTEERINKILEAAKGTYYESLVTKLINNFWN